MLQVKDSIDNLSLELDCSNRTDDKDMLLFLHHSEIVMNLYQ